MENIKKNIEFEKKDKIASRVSTSNNQKVAEILKHI
jgi:hypothetical protein